MNETIENAPDYLSEIDPVRRKEIINISAEITRDIPEAIICGGNANRILYEAYTNKIMFGVGKNDFDIYVPRADLEKFLTAQPKGYELNRQLNEDGKERWIRPEDNYIVLMHSGEHIDVFGTGDSHKSTTVELDGRTIRVQSLTDQIKDKIYLMRKTNGLTKIKIDPVHDPNPVSKYGVYAQRILEMTDSKQGRAELTKHADELPKDWREIIEAMASQGEYGDQLDPKKRDEFQKKLETWKKIQEFMKQIQGQTINNLKDYYKINRDTTSEESNSELSDLLAGLENKINKALEEASSPDDFIQKIVDKISDDEKNAVKNRIKSLAIETISTTKKSTKPPTCTQSGGDKWT